MLIARGRADAPGTQRTSTFTGIVYVDPVLVAEEDVTVNEVFFAPGSRTFWHHHERGQLLRVTTGAGLICNTGEQPRLIRAGDTVWVPPGVPHWHGATEVSCMSHTAISLGETNWLDPVLDETYQAAPSQD